MPDTALLTANGRDVARMSGGAEQRTDREGDARRQRHEDDDLDPARPHEVGAAAVRRPAPAALEDDDRQLEEPGDEHDEPHGREHDGQEAAEDDDGEQGLGEQEGRTRGGGRRHTHRRRPPADPASSSRTATRRPPGRGPA